VLIVDTANGQDMKMLSCLLLFVITTGSTIASDNLEIYAPDNTIEGRDALGKKYLGQVYRQTVAWTKKAAVIKEHVGDIVAIAPSAGLNKTACGREITCFDRDTLMIGDRAIEAH